jgi:two-component system response regulator
MRGGRGCCALRRRHRTMPGTGNNMDLLVLVEDNDDDRELAVLAFDQAKVPGKLVPLADGEQALEFLLPETGAARGRDEVKVVLLDLKLPKIDGLEVLRRLRADSRTRHVPVVVLTSSIEQADLIESYLLGANSYLRKPVNFADFVELAALIGSYWVKSNQMPPPDAV